jgi:hypothetical protein
MSRRLIALSTVLFVALVLPVAARRAIEADAEAR